PLILILSLTPSLRTLVSLIRLPPPSTLFPYTTLFRSLFFQFRDRVAHRGRIEAEQPRRLGEAPRFGSPHQQLDPAHSIHACSLRSEEHTSELQSHLNLVCRLLLEKKKCKKTRLISRSG